MTDRTLFSRMARMPADKIAARIADLEAEIKGLKVLLRSARVREANAARYKRPYAPVPVPMPPERREPCSE